MFRTIRNNWKKSLFAFCALSYGANWSYDRYQANQIRQFYCRQATLFGSQRQPSMTRVNRIAVLLNGKANNGNGKSIYDKTIFPLLHLIGLDVRVYRLDSITDVNGLTDLLKNKLEVEQLSAIMIVGGDGTLSELVPHFLQSSALENLPICLVPIGEHVSFARRLFPMTTKKKLHEDVALLCESVFALFNGTIVKRPLLKLTMSIDENKAIYASTFDFGHYSRLEQLQRRLWYFSYLKYPISSLYHLLTNSTRSIISPEQSSMFYSRSCSGCLRCQPTLIDEYRLAQRDQQIRSSFFSRVYQTNRSQAKSTPPSVSPVPVENADCGVEYTMELRQQPVQIWAKIADDSHGFQCEITDELERFNYTKETWKRQSSNVRHLRFYPNSNLIKKYLLINHEKFDSKNENEIERDTLIECRVELSERSLKFIQINPDLLINRRLTLKPAADELEYDSLAKTGIFLFSPHQQSS